MVENNSVDKGTVGTITAETVINMASTVQYSYRRCIGE
jgi:hypothetical protein